MSIFQLLMLLFVWILIW